MVEQIRFPALCFSKTSIVRLNYTHLVSGKKFMSKAFRDVKIIDCNGSCFDLSGVEQTGGVSILDSIVNFAVLFKVKPKLKAPVQVISVEDFRNKIITFLQENPRVINDVKISSTSQLASLSTHVEVINLF